MVTGIFSSVAAAQEARRTLRDVSGLRDEPDCFIADEYTVDETTWREGFTSVTRGRVETLVGERHAVTEKGR